MNGCGEWVDDLSTAVTETGIYELEYGVEGLVPWRSPERAPFEFVLLSRSFDFTFREARGVGLPGFGAPTARVVARRSGPARSVFLDELQVPAVGTGDLVLQLERIRYCGAVETSELLALEEEAAERRSEIEAMDAPANPILRVLGAVEDLSIGAAIVAGLVLLAVLWPAIRDLGEGLVKAGTKVWD